MTNDGCSALTEEMLVPSTGHHIPISQQLMGQRWLCLCVKCWQRQMRDGEIQGGQSSLSRLGLGGMLLSRKCSIWCRKLLFLFNSTCARRLLASRRCWHSSLEPARQLGVSLALVSSFL